MKNKWFRSALTFGEQTANMKVSAFLLPLIAVCSISIALGQGTILWDESVNGELSESSSPATPLSPFQLGTNSIIGVTEVEPSGAIWIVHPDFFTIQVPNGLAITAVYLQLNKPNVWHWIGDTGFLSELAFAQNPASGNLLSQWGLLSIGTGAYGMDVENHDAQPFTAIANYRLDFFVQSVPEPSASLLFLLGGIGCLAFGRWRKAHGGRNDV